MEEFVAGKMRLKLYSICGWGRFYEKIKYGGIRRLNGGIRR